MIRKIKIAILIFFAVAVLAFAYVKASSFIGRDNTPPVISAESDELTVSVNATDEELLDGLTASDNRDGDVSDTLMVMSRSMFIDEAVINVSYAATDKHNNVATYTRRVTFNDYRSPEFGLKEPLKYKVSDSTFGYTDIITVDDLIDGDISSLIRVSTGVTRTSRDDIYYIPFTVQVTNSMGDTAEVSLEAVVYNEDDYRKSAPALNTYLTYVNKNTRPNFSTYISGILVGKTETSFGETVYSSENVEIDDSGYISGTPGVYQIKYILHDPEYNMDSEEGILGTTILFVVVRE